MERQGASFVEITEPRTFIGMTRSTDADVDGMSAVYQASWKGPATFKWEGPDVGYIVRVTPMGFKPDPLPDFEKMSDAELVAALDSPSHIRTLTAQRTLLRREANPVMSEALLALAKNPDKNIKTRVAAVYAIAQSKGSLEPLRGDGDLAPFVLRAAGDLGSLPAVWVTEAAKSSDPRTRSEAAVAAARQNVKDAAPAIAALLGDPDPRVAHTAFQALARLGAKDTAIEALLTGPNSKGASFALMRMHDVPGIVEDLQAENRALRTAQIRNTAQPQLSACAAPQLTTALK